MTDDLAPRPAASPAGWGHRLGRWLDVIVTTLNTLGTAWIFVMMMLIVIDVGMRFFFNSPVRGVPLIITMSIVAIVFLQLADALRAGRLTRSDVLIGKLLNTRPVLGHWMQAVFHFAGVVLMVVLVRFSMPLLEKAWRLNSYDGTEGDFTFPEWPIKAVVVVGAGVCAIQFLRLFFADIRFLAGQRGASRGDFGMSSVDIGLVSIIGVLVLVYIGVHIGVALSLLSFIGVSLIREDMTIAGKLLALAAGESLRRFEFGVIPLFVLMGLLVSVSGIGKDTYDVANHLFRRVKAGLGTATVAANAVFAAVTGSSIASASVFTKVAVPEMLRLGYNPRFAVGVVAGSSVLGMLIPPSMLLILFGILTESSIGALFIAGILPGILLAAAFSVLNWVLAHRFPNFVAIGGEVQTAESLMEDR